MGPVVAGLGEHAIEGDNSGVGDLRREALDGPGWLADKLQDGVDGIADKVEDGVNGAKDWLADRGRDWTPPFLRR